jgi:hypothetical protein
VVPGVADGEGPVVGEDLEEAARDGDGLLLGHLGFDPPHVHRPLPGEVPPEHLPRRPSEPTAATPEELHPAAASVAARSLAGVEFQLKPNPPTRGSGGPSWARQSQNRRPISNNISAQRVQHRALPPVHSIIFHVH